MPNSWEAYLYQRPDPIVGAVYLSSHWNHYFIALTSLVLHIAHKPDVYFLIFVRILIMTKVSSRWQFILDPGPTIVLPCLKITGSLSQCLKVMLLMMSVMRLMMFISATVVVSHFKVRAHVIVFKLFIDVLLALDNHN